MKVSHRDVIITICTICLFQALLAMGNKVGEDSTSMKALWADVEKGTYHNPMAISQILPALQQSSYLHLKNKDCSSEDGLYSYYTHSSVTPVRSGNIMDKIF